MKKARYSGEAMIKACDNRTSFIESPFGLLFGKKRLFKCSVRDGEIAGFMRDLSTLVNAGVPLVKSLEVLARQQANKAFGAVVKNLGILVYSGVPFSTSLMRYSKIFSALFVSMVRAGEASCNLGAVLERIARHREKEIKLRKKIRSTMVYPLIVVSMAILIVSMLFLFIIPKFESVFSTAFNGAVLPLATRMIIEISHLFKEIFIVLMVGFVGIFFGLGFIRKEIKDGLILRLPIIGKVIRDINIALFSRILGTLLANGVPLLEALKISEEVATNFAVRGSLRGLSVQVKDGEAFSNAIEKGGKFPEMVVGMTQVGEETGTLSNMLLEIANKLEEDTELALGNLTSVLEPLMTVLLAVVIGAIVIALFLPIVSVMNSIGSF